MIDVLFDQAFVQNPLKLDSYRVVDQTITDQISFNFLEEFGASYDLVFSNVKFEGKVDLSSSGIKKINVSFSNCEFCEILNFDLLFLYQSKVVFDKCLFKEKFHIKSDKYSDVSLEINDCWFNYWLNITSLSIHTLTISNYLFDQDSFRLELFDLKVVVFNLNQISTPGLQICVGDCKFNKASFSDIKASQLDINNVTSDFLHISTITTCELNLKYSEITNLLMISNINYGSNSSMSLVGNTVSDNMFIDNVNLTKIQILFSRFKQLKKIRLRYLICRDFEFDFQDIVDNASLIKDYTSIKYINADVALSHYLKLESRRSEKKVDEIFYSAKELKAHLNNTKLIKSTFGDWVILKLGWYSNKFNTSWLSGLRYTVLVSWFFFLLYEITLNKSIYKFGWISWSSFSNALNNLFSAYFQFISLLHDFDFIENNQPNAVGYFLDTVGRIFIGYGVYQTVQAFRKYGKN